MATLIREAIEIYLAGDTNDNNYILEQTEETDTENCLEFGDGPKCTRDGHFFLEKSGLVTPPEFLLFLAIVYQFEVVITGDFRYDVPSFLY